MLGLLSGCSCHSDVSPAKQSEGRMPRIVGIKEAPHFLIDNKYLTKGYRHNYRKTTDILKSAFKAHNETLNIWTHFMAFVYAILILGYIISSQLSHDSLLKHIKELHLSDQ